MYIFQASVFDSCNGRIILNGTYYYRHTPNVTVQISCCV